MTNPTICSACQHVHEDSRKGHPRYWLCVKFPSRDGFGFVTRDTWDKAEPYRRCGQINTEGMCPLFEPIETGEVT